MNKFGCSALLLLGLVATNQLSAEAAPGMGMGMGAEAAPAPVEYTYVLSGIESGSYILEHDHGRVHWTVSHHGFSMFTAVFPTIDATLDYVADDITKSQLEVVIDMTAVSSHIEIFDERLNSSAWLDTKKYPTSVFKSTSIKVTSDNTLDVTGDLTFMGETQPLTMQVTFAKAGTPARPPGGYRIGFDATATMLRSEWGMPKSTVGDEVKLLIEAEFLRPPTTN